MERRKSRRLDGAPGANGPLPALHLRGDLECVTLRCSSGRLCPWHAGSVPEPLTGSAVLLLQPHCLESPTKRSGFGTGRPPAPPACWLGVAALRGWGRWRGLPGEAVGNQVCRVPSPLGDGEHGHVRCFQPCGLGTGTGRELSPGPLLHPD